MEQRCVSTQIAWMKSVLRSHAEIVKLQMIPAAADAEHSVCMCAVADGGEGFSIACRRDGVTAPGEGEPMPRVYVERDGSTGQCACRRIEGGREK